MSRRKQSNPKPIKHDDDRDEMDGCMHSTTGNGDPLSAVSAAAAVKENQNTLVVRDNRQHTLDGLDKFSNNVWDSQGNGTGTSSELVKQSNRKPNDSHTVLSLSKTSNWELDQKDEPIKNNKDEALSKDDDDTIPCSAPSANHLNLKAMASVIKSTSSNEDQKSVLDSDNHCHPKPNVCGNTEVEARKDLAGSSSDSHHTKPFLDSTTSSHDLPFPKSLNDPEKSDVIHVMSQHSHLANRALGERQNVTNDVFQNKIEDSEEEGVPKQSVMARFPIIPNGKGYSNSSRLLSQHRVTIEDCNRTKPNSLNAVGVTNSEAETESRASSAISDSENNRHSHPRPSPVGSPTTSSSKVDTNLTRCQEEAELALVNQLQLPSDVLYLRQQEVSIHGVLNLGWVVCCAIPLPQNSSLGPFQGQLVAPEDVKVGDLIVQFTNKRGQQALMNVAGQSGGWLALLRTPQTPDQRNTHVYWEGGRIWCEIVSDIDMGTELRATFSFQHEEEEEEELQEKQGAELPEHRSSSSPSRDEAGHTDLVKVKAEQPSLHSSNSSDACDGSSMSTPQPHQHQLPPHPNQQLPSPGHAALIYGCPFCGVRFSSPRTLQGHLSFYCSKKTSGSSLYTPASGGSGTNGVTGVKHNKGSNQPKSDSPNVKQEPGEQSPEERAPKRRASDTEGASDFNPSPSTAKISGALISRRSPSETSDHPVEADDIYECDRCSFSTDRVSSMNSHKRMHANEDAAKSSTRTHNRVENTPDRLNPPLQDLERHSTASLLKPSSSDTFCKECKIQFSSMRTFKCHKEHYCAQRRKKSLAEPSPFSAMFNSPFPFPPESAGTSASLPSALRMSALSQRGLILPGNGNGMTTAAAAAMILQANMAALSLPGMIMHQRDLRSTPDLLIRHPLSLTGPSRETNLDSSHKIRNSLHPRYPNMESKLEAKQIPNGLSSVALKRNSPKSTSPSKSPGRDLKRSSEAESNRPRSQQQEVQKVSTTDKSVIHGRGELREEDHPLDLSLTKPGGNEPQTTNSESSDLCDVPRKQKILHQGSPIQFGTSESPSSAPVAPPNLSPRTRRAHAYDSLHSIDGLRKDSIPPVTIHSHLMAHSDNPALLLRPPGFLSILSSSSTSDRALNTFPPVKRRRPDSPNAVARTISKCLDCNIVFYKHDNYLVHKQYYCSGKRRPQQPSSRSESPSSPTIHPINTAPLSPQRMSLPSHSPHRRIETSPISSSGSLKVLSPQPPQNSKSPPRQQQTGKAKYKFFCVPCRIKFSNASILEAHKEYYCPAGKDSEQSVIFQTGSSSSDDPSSQVASLLSPHGDDGDGDGHRGGTSSPEPQHEEVTCNRCNSVFTSARLLRLHVCEGGFPCPHCDHVAITENRLAEHLKVHAPTRAYRCTICGYRGNTARGMRMHGKTHIDEGVNFTDENMLEYEEPAVMPILSHASTSGLSGSATTDSELLRLKNEPYKRRRSRKAYEKFDYPLPKVDIPQTCPLCGQNFANADFLASHFKVHQIAASQYLAGLMKCIHCTYVGKSPEDLRAHFEANHASNHRIHFPQRVSAVDAVRDQHSGELVTGNDTEDEKGDVSERSSPEETQRLMVITDPNSPLNERNLKTESDFTGDDREVSQSPSPFPVDIKEEPMEQEECVDSQDEHVDHFLHIPTQLNANITGKQQSPPLRKLSVSPSVFLRQKNSSSRSSEVVHESIESGPVADIQDCSPGITIKSEPLEVGDSQLPAESSPQSTQDDDPNLSKAVPSPQSSAGGSSVMTKNGVMTKASNYEREELNENIPNCSPIRLPPPSLPLPQPMNIQVKQELPENDRPAPNFLSSPGSRSDTKTISPEASPHSPNLSNQRSRQSPENQPKLYISQRTVSPTPSTSRHRTSPKQSPTLVSPIVPPASLSSSPFPPHGIVSHHSLPFPYPNPQTLPFFFLPGQARFSGPRQPFLVSSREDRDSRYCQNCDIAFSKQATYLAHKKYYCTARPRGEPQPSATA